MKSFSAQVGLSTFEGQTMDRRLYMTADDCSECSIPILTTGCATLNAS